MYFGKVIMSSHRFPFTFAFVVVVTLTVQCISERDDDILRSYQRTIFATDALKSSTAQRSSLLIDSVVAVTKR